jgi:hypothetical protein
VPRLQPLSHHRSHNFAGQTGRSFTPRVRSSFVALFTLIGATLPALAQESRCVVDPHDSTCGLDSTLHLLRWLAIILAIILIAIVVIAIAAYRRNQRTKLTRDD